MPISVKDGGAWKTATPSVKDGGTWKTVQEGYVKDGGTWKLFFQNVVFTPNGGDSAESPVALDAIGGWNTSISILCNQPATWTYTNTGIHGNATIPSGSVSTGISFSLSTAGNNKIAYFTVSATAGSVTKYWTVTLEVGLE